MAHVAHSNAVLLNPLADRFAALVASVKSALARRAEVARVFNELNSLTERDLDDLDISRLDIRGIAQQAGKLV